MSELNIESECTTLIKWQLANFSTVAARDHPQNRVKSDVFQLDSSAIKCYLEFQPTNLNGTDRNYSSIYLRIKDFAGQSTIKLRFGLWIENELGEKISERLSKCLLKLIIILDIYRSQVYVRQV
jgi:hypothetical protein